MHLTRTIVAAAAGAALLASASPVQADTRTETQRYTGSPVGLCSSTIDLEGPVSSNQGMVCFELDGSETEATVSVSDHHVDRFAVTVEHWVETSPRRYTRQPAGRHCSDAVGTLALTPAKGLLVVFPHGAIDRVNDVMRGDPCGGDGLVATAGTITVVFR